MPARRLSYPAPRRESVQTDLRTVEEVSYQEDSSGEFHAKMKKISILTYHTKPWSLSAVLDTIASGGWFGSHAQHDFEPGVAEFAQDARAVYTDLMGGTSHQISSQNGVRYHA